MPGQPQATWTTWPPTSPNTAFGVDAYQLNVIQTGAMDPSLIIDPDVPATVELVLRVGGNMAAAFHAAKAVGTAQFFYEGYGNADKTEGQIGGVVTVASNSGIEVPGGMQSYEYKISSDALSLPSGIYKLAATVSFGTPWNIFAFIEGTAINVR